MMESGGVSTTGTATRRIVVLYPFGIGHYVDREFLGFVPGYETHFVVPSPGFAFTGEAAISVVLAKYHLIWPPRGGLTIVSTFIPDLTSLLKKLHPDVVVTYELHSSLTYSASRLKESLGFFHIVLCYETGSPSASCWGWFPLTRALARRSVRCADMIIAHTDRAKTSIQELGPPTSKLHRIYPGVYRQNKDRGPPPFNPGSTMKVGYLGGFRANKGIITLLDAIESYNNLDTSSRVRFLIAGKGPLASKVQAAADRFGNVQLRGWITPEGKANFMREIDLLVYPSSQTRLMGLLRWEEQTATSALEAMAQGIPVLGSTSGALPEILGGAGALFRMDSPDDLANELAILSNNRRDFPILRQKAWKRAEQHFDIYDAGQRLGSLLSEACGN